jgi:hypothetical protein
MIWFYEEEWADYRLVVWQDAGLWSFQIDVWSVDRFLASGGGSGWHDGAKCVQHARQDIFKRMKIAPTMAGTWVK